MKAVNCFNYRRLAGNTGLIIYDLECANSHRFEGWFKNREACEEQMKAKNVSCPVCGNTQMSLAPSQVAVTGIERRSDGGDPARKAMTPLGIMNAIKRYVDANFDDVGESFADVALKIHHGEEDERNIKGVATPDQEEMLRDEGVHFLKLSLPKLDS